MVIQCIACPAPLHVPHRQTTVTVTATATPSPPPSLTTTRRTSLVSLILTTSLPFSPPSSYSAINSDFFVIPNSGGVKALDLRVGTGPVPIDGDQRQNKDGDSIQPMITKMILEPLPFVFTLGSGKVISGIEAAVRSMKVSGLRRVVIPPSQGYQNTSQEPLPPNFFDRQRLFTTIFNPTRLANGEGSTLGTLIFDIELVSVRR
ncbi:hypothetical protein ACFE04_031135 [Oxalis oulophora]